MINKEEGDGEEETRRRWRWGRIITMRRVIVRRIWWTRRRRWRWIIKDQGRLSGTEGNHWRRRDILAHLENGFSGFAR